MTIAVLGEALIDMIDDDDGKYQPHLGGSPFNVAIALARQGVRVSYLSPLSDDNFGDQLYAALSTEQVALPLSRRSRLPTSMAMVTLDGRGQASYRLYREAIADKDISADEIIAHLPEDLSLFHTGSLAITPSQLPKINAVFASLRGRGTPISIDLNVRTRASTDRHRYLEGVRSLIPLVDIVKASDEDLEAFALSADPLETARRFHRDMAGGLLVLTRGAEGAAVLFGDEAVSAPVHPVTTLIDTVGAGDTFHAAFLAQLTSQNALPGGAFAAQRTVIAFALGFAGAAAAINVSREGCNPPTREEVLQILNAR